MENPTRRTALKTFGLTIGATCASLSLTVAEELFASDESKQPIRLGVIADLHGGLAVDAEMRLDAFLNAMQGIARQEGIGSGQCEIRQLGRPPTPGQAAQSSWNRTEE